MFKAFVADLPGRIRHTASWLRCGLAVFAAFSVNAVELPLHVGEAEEEPWKGPPEVREKVEELNSRDHGQSAAKRPFRIHRVQKLDIGKVVVNPDSPDVPIFPVPAVGETGPIVPNTPQTTGVNFTGATLADTLAYPPDSMGAVGPAQYIVAVNGRIRTFNKQTGAADGV